MEARTVDCCCGLVELGNFTSDTTKESIIKCLTNYYEERIEWDGREVPHAIFATTRKSEQQNAEKALAELGFRPRNFKSRYQIAPTKDPDLTFWWRSTPPREVKREITKMLKSRKDDWE